MTRGIKGVTTHSGRTSEENSIVEVEVDLTSTKDVIERFEITPSGAHHVESIWRKTRNGYDDGPTEAAVREVVSHSNADDVYVDGQRVAKLTVNL